MPRILQKRSLKILSLAAASQSLPRLSASVLTRAISTSFVAREKKPSWFRNSLWKGDAPGPDDPYAQKSEPETSSNLPAEALEPQPQSSRADMPPEAVLLSRLVLPPERTEATAEAELQATDTSYVPATEISELEETSMLQNWWDQPGHWGEESRFRAFGSPQQVTDKDVFMVYLRRAVIELLALQTGGVFSQWVTRRWRQGDMGNLKQALAVKIHIDGAKVALSGDVSAVLQSLMNQAEDVRSLKKMSAAEARHVAKSWDPTWKQLTLTDETRFALRKRLYQLTGILIPDSKLGAARTVEHVLAIAIKSAKAPKLVEVLKKRSSVENLANVKVHEHRIGLVEKETAIGRWKVIEKELRKRALPVMGPKGMTGNKERSWLMGRI